MTMSNQVRFKASVTKIFSSDFWVNFRGSSCFFHPQCGVKHVMEQTFPCRNVTRTTTIYMKFLHTCRFYHLNWELKLGLVEAAARALKKAKGVENFLGLIAIADIS